jgi:hypothetical protein
MQDRQAGDSKKILWCATKREKEYVRDKKKGPNRGLNAGPLADWNRIAQSENHTTRPSGLSLSNRCPSSRFLLRVIPHLLIFTSQPNPERS